MSGQGKHATIAARVPHELRLELEAKRDELARAGVHYPDGRPVDLSYVIRVGLRHYLDGPAGPLAAEGAVSHETLGELRLVDERPETVTAARRRLHADLAEGARCPVCDQYARIYRRKLNSRMARALIRVYRNAGREWAHVPTIAGDGCEFGKLRYWELVEELDERRDDGGRAGWWRITDLGEAYVLRRRAVPKYARIYDGKLIDLDGPPVHIDAALGDRFDYDELMAPPDRLAA